MGGGGDPLIALARHCHPRPGDSCELPATPCTLVHLNAFSPILPPAFLLQLGAFSCSCCGSLGSTAALPAQLSPGPWQGSATASCVQAFRKCQNLSLCSSARTKPHRHPGFVCIPKLSAGSCMGCHSTDRYLHAQLLHALLCTVSSVGSQGLSMQMC